MLNLFKKQTTNVNSYQATRQYNDRDRASQPFRQHRPDYGIVVISIALLITGLIVVYSISPALAAGQDVSGSYYVFKQLIAIALGLVAFVVLSSTPLNAIKNSAKPLIIFSGIMVVLVQLFGEKVNGAYRWIQIGGISFQVAELLKFTIIVWLASFLINRMREGSIQSFDKTIKPLLYLLGAVGVVVTFLESDFGSTAVIVAIIGLMALSAGMPIKRIAMFAAAVVILLSVMIVTTPYRRERIATFLNPTSDCQDEGYQTCQALIAVGSGGIMGLGVGHGVQAYGYLPEAENDSIFAIVGEKFGFVGTTIIIGLYAMLFARMRKIILRTADPFGRLFVIGVLAWLSIQTMINVGAMIGLLPLKGITLPLISYGGTSLVFILAALGVVFQVSRYTSFSPLRSVSASNLGGPDENSVGRGRQRRPYYAATRGS